MPSQSKLSQLRRKLLKRRERILKTHGELEASRQKLREPEVEFEEGAQKEAIPENLEQVDIREKEELDAIDRALRKIEAGAYGLCESCGRKVSLQRLEALPWATLCGACQRKSEEAKTPLPAESERTEKEPRSDLPPEYQDLSDEEIVETVRQQLREEGRVELEELEITCTGGILSLRGLLPSEKERQTLLQILQDPMGFTQLSEEIQIDPLLWQREDRAPGKTVPPSIEGVPVEQERQNVFASRTEGIPFIPPDELVPEEKK
jgi:DnaK suppressor protein